MSHDVLHIERAILVGPEDTRPGVWVGDGRISYAAPGAGADVQTVRGWILPGLVDGHCHVGLDAHGEVDAERDQSVTLSRGCLGRSAAPIPRR